MKKKKSKLHEYAFDVRLNAVVRVTARDIDAARKVVDGIQVEDVNHTCVECDGDALITEVSVDDSEIEPHLFEIDSKHLDPLLCRRPHRPENVGAMIDEYCDLED